MKRRQRTTETRTAIASGAGAVRSGITETLMNRSRTVKRSGFAYLAGVGRFFSSNG